MSQLALSFARQRTEPARPKTIAERFEEFHAAHPEVYRELVRLARQRKRAGFERCGIRVLWEVCRWNMEMSCGDGEFKLNNNYAKHFSLLIMEQESDLADFFETRERSK